MKDNIHSNLNKFEYVDLKKIRESLSNFYNFTNEREVLAEEIIKIIKPRSDHSMIDIGCGEGNLIIRMHEKLNYCVALDPDIDKLIVLKNKLKQRSNVFLVQSKFESFVTRRNFDITVSSHTLSFFREKFNMVEKMAEITKKNGKVILVLHSQEGEQMLLLEDINKRVMGRCIRHLCAETLYSYVRERGYSSDLKLVETNARFNSVEEIAKLSYFFFRINLNELANKKKVEVKDAISDIFLQKGLEISSVHGIIVIDIK